MEMALDCLLYYNRREAYPRPESPTSKTIEALRAALAEAEAEAPNPWREAVHDALVILFELNEKNAEDPRQAVADLVAAEVRIALDPAVSSDAQALIDRGKAEAPKAEPVAWLPIGTAPKNMSELAFVRWVDRHGKERRDIDFTEDGCWVNWQNNPENIEAIGGPQHEPPYTHWMPQPPSPGAHPPEPVDEEVIGTHICGAESPLSREWWSGGAWLYPGDCVVVRRAVLAHGRKG